jgi:ankyrin repeat protein
MDKGASVNARSTDDETALQKAAERGNAEMVALLIEKGASVHAITPDKEIPLQWAAQCVNPKTAGLLIEKGGIRKQLHY